MQAGRVGQVTSMNVSTRKPSRACLGLLLGGSICSSIVGAREAGASDEAKPPLPPTPSASEVLPGESDDSGPKSRAGSLSGFVGWAFNVPLGSVRDFTNTASLLGFELQAHAWLSARLSLGLSAEWAMYTDTLEAGSYSLEQADSTARGYGKLQTTSVRLLAHYAPPLRSEFQPYIGPLVGVSWAAFELEAADVVRSDTKFSVNVGAEAGILISFEGGGPAAVVNLRYSTSPAAGFGSSVTNVQSLGLLLGIGF
jgi:hypothetical protein